MGTKIRPKYRQPHSIHAPHWMNEALAQKYIERRHHYEKYTAKYKTQRFINDKYHIKRRENKE